MEKTLARLELHHGPGFGDHGSRVALLSEATARHLGFSERETARLRLAALVHDIGKTDVDPDVYDVMTTGRSYRPPMSIKQTGEQLDRMAGSQFDPDIVAAFASIDRSLLKPLSGNGSATQ